jgi:hypothetical protein
MPTQKRLFDVYRKHGLTVAPVASQGDGLTEA